MSVYVETLQMVTSVITAPFCGTERVLPGTTIKPKKENITHIFYFNDR